MENRLLVKILFLLLAISTSATIGSTLHAKDRQDLRLYRVNKDGISDRFWFTRGKARKPGCHNIRKRSRLHRAVQFGYPACYVFTKKNCPADDIVSFTKEDETTPNLTLLEGYSWFSISEHKRGQRIKSWYCGEPIEEITQAEVVIKEEAALKEKAETAIETTTEHQTQDSE